GAGADSFDGDADLLGHLGPDAEDAFFAVIIVPVFAMTVMLVMLLFLVSIMGFVIFMSLVLLVFFMLRSIGVFALGRSEAGTERQGRRDDEKKVNVFHGICPVCVVRGVCWAVSCSIRTPNTSAEVAASMALCSA